MTETSLDRSPAERALRDEIADLTRANIAGRSAANERRLRELRHELGIELARDPSPGDYPVPDFDRLDRSSPVPEVGRDELTPEILRAAILTNGCLLVRGLLDGDEAKRMEDEIEGVFEAREADEEENDAYFEKIEVEPPYEIVDREWVTDAGGLWAADSPRVMFEMLEAFDRHGLTDVIRGYLGEDPAFSVQKCTFRKVPPTAGNGFPGWHQDGRFLGEVRALNVWVTLTSCGTDAPGLDLVPKRIEKILPTGTGEAIFNWVVPPESIDEVRGDAEVVRPEFEPGDAMLFDDLFLHSTAANPSMPNHRYAIESWFFGPSGFPKKYAPLAL